MAISKGEFNAYPQSSTISSSGLDYHLLSICDSAHDGMVLGVGNVCQTFFPRMHGGKNSNSTHSSWGSWSSATSVFQFFVWGPCLAVLGVNLSSLFGGPCRRARYQTQILMQARQVNRHWAISLTLTSECCPGGKGTACHIWCHKVLQDTVVPHNAHQQNLPHRGMHRSRGSISLHWHSGRSLHSELHTCRQDTHPGTYQQDAEWRYSY